ncbi:hypothetical protein LguiB_005918 [Lonicera macranthoides]
MAESFVFQTAGKILGKLTTLTFHEIGLIWGVKKDFKRLELTVSAIKAILLDAAKQRKKSRQAEDWLEKIQDVLYDVDNVLDDFMTEDLRRKVVIKGSKRKEVKNFFSSYNSLALRITLSRKLKKIRSRLEDIDDDRKQFDLIERSPNSPVVVCPLREQTHSFVRAYDVIGRDLDKNRIIKLLLKNSSSSASSKEVSHVNYDTMNIFEGTRHLLFSAVRLNGKEFPHFLRKLNKVRSFSFQFEVGPISKTFVNTLIKTFGCLYYLDLNGSEFEELPSSIGTLKHLRYLNLFNNSRIKALPNTICNLVNLQTLSLIGCVMLQDLPRDFGNLSSLRTLYLTSKMTCFPKKGHAEGLRSLQYLSIVSCDHLESLSGGMKNFSALRHLIIYKCPSLTSLPAESMKYLTSLEVLWIWKCEKLNLLAEEDKMMELRRGFLSLALWDIPKLKELPRGFENAAETIKYIRIDGCPSFETLPEWLQNCTSLTKLQLINCMLLESLPLRMHQLTSLRFVRIKNCYCTLSRKCEKETNEYWPRISRNPEIHLE